MRTGGEAICPHTRHSSSANTVRAGEPFRQTCPFNWTELPANGILEVDDTVSGKTFGGNDHGLPSDSRNYLLCPAAGNLQ